MNGSVFEFWSSRRQRAEQLRKGGQLRLDASQRSQLLGNHEVREALQNERMTSLLPPVGTEVFRRLTPASQHDGRDKEKEKKKEEGDKTSPKPAHPLQARKLLPFIYGDPPPEFLCTPLEDLDPFYQSQKTFMVISKGNIIHRFNAERACYLLSPFSPVRTVAIKILLHPLFSLCLMLTILINCVFMMIRVPGLSRYMEDVFMAVYTFDIILKILSRGFCVGNFTFLWDPWNWLDVLIITGFAAQFTSSKFLELMTTIPRVMKLFTCRTGLRRTVEALVQSVMRLADVIILIVVVLSILAMIGLQFFMGQLNHKCVIWPPINTSTYEIPSYHGNETGSFDFSAYINNSENCYYLPHHLDALLCGNRSDSGVCPEGMTCLRTSTNPNYGFTNYDSFGFSFLTMFRLLMQDFWDNLIHLTLRAAGKSYFTVFMLIFLPGGFFLLSITMAAVAMARVEQEEADAAEAKKTEEEFSRIVEVLKRREEEEASRRAELPEEPDKKNPPVQRCIDTLLRKDCCGCWRWLRQQLCPFVESPFFDLGIAVCIIINAIFMAMEHYPMSHDTDYLLTRANVIFIAIFTTELLIRLVALGLRSYFQVSRNIFDFVVVVAGLLELLLTEVEGLSLLRALRLLRLLRLERWWAELHLLMKTIWTSVGNLSLVLLFMVFVFSVAGMQLFKNDYESCVCKISTDCELPRWHMWGFFHSFLLIVRILCGEWIETLWDCMEVSSQSTCVIFFMMVIVIGNLLILNLFLSLLLGSFSSSQLAEEKGTNNLQIVITQTNTWILEHVRTLLGKKNNVDLDHKAAEGKNSGRKEYLALTLATSDQQGFDRDNLGEEGEDIVPCQAPAAEANIKFKTPEGKKEKDQQMSKLQDDEDPTRNTPEDCCCDSCYRCCAIQGVDTSRGAGRVWSKLRRVCLLIVQHRVFEGFIVFIILLSSAALMFEDVHPQQGLVLQVILDKFDHVFTYVFLVEMLLKWIAFGFKKYFSSFWNWLDFLILDVSLISLTANILGSSTRSLRALRTLRAPSRFKGIRVVLRSLMLSLPSLCRTLLVTAFIWLLFGILGVNLFAGKFYYCFNETSAEYFAPEEVTNMTDCLELQLHNFTEVRWKNGHFNFDNVGMSFLSLFIVSLSAGWHDILYPSVDSTEIENQPEYESNLYTYLYFILFVIVGGFFTWNIFIRAFVNALHHQVGEKHVFMTVEQLKHSRAVAKKFFKKPDEAPPRPQSRCQAWLFDRVTSLPSEVFMVAVICVYMVVLMVETDGQSREKFEVLMWFQTVAIFIFLTEFILKIIALRQHYFSSGLNIIDFAVLVGLIIGTFTSDLFQKYLFNPGVLAVLRLARVIHILRYIRCTRRIRMLILGFVTSYPALLNIGLLLFLVVYTYSYIGMCAFAHVKRGAMIDDMFNFETFGNSIIVMMMVSPSSLWDGLLLPMMDTPPDCDPDVPGSPLTGNCGSPTVGIIFFTSYILLYILLVVHLFIAIIVESFNSRNLEDATPLSEEHLQMFYNTWSKFDPDGSQVIQYRQLSDFCDALQEPLKITKPNSIRLILMDLPLLPGDQVRCLDVLCAVTRQGSDESGDTNALKARLEGKFNINIISKVSCEPISSTLRRKQEEVAAAVIQRAFRKHLQVRRASCILDQSVGEA